MKNITPMSTPTVVIDAWSNWRIDQADRDPEDSGHQPEPPEVGEVADRLPGLPLTA